MSPSPNTSAHRWGRRFVVGVATTLALMLAVAVAGRHSHHQAAAIITLACLHLAGTAYGALCLWHLYQATLPREPDPLRP
jgi:hypothetical protein